VIYKKGLSLLLKKKKSIFFPEMFIPITTLRIVNKNFSRNQVALEHMAVTSVFNFQHFSLLNINT
jgi:hypothetical protein